MSSQFSEPASADKSPFPVRDKGKTRDIELELGGENEPPKKGASNAPRYKDGTLYPTEVPPDGEISVETPSIKKVRPKMGRRSVRDPRLIDYDLVSARQRPSVAFSVPKLDRMSAKEAGDMLKDLHAKFDLVGQNDEVLWAFDKALFFNHTINGASPVQQGDGDIVVANQVNPEEPLKISMKEIMVELGFKARKFFRAFADLTTVVNREIIAERDPLDRDSMDRYDQLLNVASSRGMIRFPELCHDSADACYDVSLEERATILASKAKVIAQSSKIAQETNPFYKVET